MIVVYKNQRINLDNIISWKLDSGTVKGRIPKERHVIIFYGNSSDIPCAWLAFDSAKQAKEAMSLIDQIVSLR